MPDSAPSCAAAMPLDSLSPPSISPLDAVSYRAAPPPQTTVLLVDDDPQLLRALRRALRNQPYRLLTAPNGNEALLILKTQAVDVVVSDERMPGMPGTELLHWVARECPDVVRILLTGHPDLQAAVRALNQCRAFRLLTKPCKDFELAMTIREGLEHRRLVLENRRLFELNRSQVVRLELANRELEAFSQTLAHDLCQPLQALRLWCDLIRSNLGLPPAEMQKLVDQALASVDRMAALISDLRAYAGLAVAPSPPMPTNLDEVVAEVLEDLTTLLRTANATVCCEPLPTILGHGCRLRQLFQNLLENAVKYRSAEDPRITIRAERVGQGWRVSVADNGLGIPEADQGRIFEAFQR
ncbi:MAG: hybrid sensor histidine kinase/response regulator, partial [Pirellulales bacterium]|nr:hybrid sensor histidine kinase/response regulator [Pirellulales bacterium]